MMPTNRLQANRVWRLAQRLEFKVVRWKAKAVHVGDRRLCPVANVTGVIVLAEGHSRSAGRSVQNGFATTRRGKLACSTAAHYGLSGPRSSQKPGPLLHEHAWLQQRQGNSRSLKILGAVLIACHGLCA